MRAILLILLALTSGGCASLHRCHQESVPMCLLEDGTATLATWTVTVCKATQ